MTFSCKLDPYGRRLTNLRGCFRHANHFHGFNPTSYIDPGILSQYDPPSNFVNPQPTVLTFEPSVAPPPMVAHYPTGHGTLAELDDTGDALASYLEITYVD